MTRLIAFISSMVLVTSFLIAASSRDPADNKTIFVEAIKDSTIENSAISPGAATNSNKVTMPTGSTSTLNALTRSAGAVYYNTDTQVLQYDNATVLQDIGSGAGGAGETNYLSGASVDFEGGDGAWIVFDDGAVSTPVDGIGVGATNIASFQSITMPSGLFVKLRGDKAGRADVIAGGAGLQGEGISVDFTVDNADINKLLKVEFDYANFGDLTAGDLGVWVRCDNDGSGSGAYLEEVTAGSDGTVNNIVTPSEVPQPARFVGSWVGPVDEADRDCRLILMFRTATCTGGCDFQIDDVLVGPGQIKTGAVVSDWTLLTGSDADTLFGTHDCSSADQAKVEYRRVGSNMEIRYFYQDCNFTGAGNFQWEPPAGLTLDTSQLISRQPVGVCYANPQFSQYYEGVAMFSGSTGIMCGSEGTNLWSGSGAFPFTWNNTDDQVGVTVTVPILEWQGSGTVNLITEQTLTEPKSFTPVFENCGSPCGISGSPLVSQWHWWRVGRFMHIEFTYEHNGTAGDNGDNAYDLLIPGGYTIDQTITSPNNSVSQSALGEFACYDGSTHWQGTPYVQDATHVSFAIHDEGAASNVNTWASSVVSGKCRFGALQARASATFKVPILEWANSPSPLIGFAFASNEQGGLVGELDGGVACDASDNICSGVTTPSASCSLNCGTCSVDTDSFHFTKIGDYVRWDAVVIFSPAFINTYTTCDVDLPIPSDFAASTDGSGSCVVQESNPSLASFGFVRADSGLDKLVVGVTDPPTTGGRGYRCTGGYRIR